MSVYKDEKTNTWRVIYRYTDWKGEKKQTQKRGFQTKREAQVWEREQLNKIASDLDMNFASFVETYSADMKSRIKENTALKQENSSLKSVREKLTIASLQKEISEWKNKYQKVLDFIEKLNLTKQLQEFLKPMKRTLHR